MGIRIMATYTREIATEFNFPNITVYHVLADGVLTAYEVRTNMGYVMYNPNANDTELDPETMQERPVIYCYAYKGMPKNYNFANFPWVAVPRNSVDKNYIFDINNDDRENA